MAMHQPYREISELLDSPLLQDLEDELAAPTNLPVLRDDHGLRLTKKRLEEQIKWSGFPVSDLRNLLESERDLVVAFHGPLAGLTHDDAEDGEDANEVVQGFAAGFLMSSVLLLLFLRSGDRKRTRDYLKRFRLGGATYEKELHARWEQLTSSE